MKVGGDGFKADDSRSFSSRLFCRIKLGGFWIERRRGGKKLSVILLINGEIGLSFSLPHG